MEEKHVRQQIREAFEALLKSPPLATTGDRVLIGRDRPLEARHEPTLLIYTTLPEQPETSEVSDTGEVTNLDRELTVAVAASTDTEDHPDDLLDRIALEVETRVGTQQKLGELAQEVTLVRTSQDTVAQGTRRNGRMIMHWRVRYETAEGAPGAAL